MFLGYVEMILLVLIVGVLFGPKIIAFIQKYQRLYTMRNKRLQKVAAQRHAEQLAAREVRNAKLKIVGFSLLGALVLSGGLYLAFWPVGYPVASYAIADGQAFDASAAAIGATLDSAETIEVDGYANITQMRFYNDWLYAVAEGGVIFRVRENGTGLTELVRTGGEIVSFDFDAEDNIIFTDAQYQAEGGALLKASFDGFAVTVEPLLTQSAGRNFACLTAVEVAADGMIYFINATEVSATEQGVTSVLRTAQIAHTQDGVLYAYDPERESCEVMLTGLGFSTGLALSTDEMLLYVTQFADASVWSVAVSTRLETLSGEGASVFVDDLSGYPVGVFVAEDGTVWVSLYAQQVAWFESLSALPAWREVMLRLPEGTRAYLLSYNTAGQVAAFASDGSLAASYQASNNKTISQVANACVVGSRLYLAQNNDRAFICYVVA